MDEEQKPISLDATPVKKVVGRPFSKGIDARREGNGKKPGYHSAIQNLKRYLSEDQLARQIAIGVLRGNLDFIKVACDYMWGKPIQRNENINENINIEGIEITLVSKKKEIEDNGTGKTS